jgi:hypothetical protein
MFCAEPNPRLPALPLPSDPHLYDGFPRTEGWKTMDEQPRPRASSWQIAGVWISAAALLVAAVRAAVDLWLLFGP